MIVGGEPHNVPVSRRNFPRNAAPQWRYEIAAAQELHAIVAVLSA